MVRSESLSVEYLPLINSTQAHPSVPDFLGEYERNLMAQWDPKALAYTCFDDHLCENRGKEGLNKDICEIYKMSQILVGRADSTPSVPSCTHSAKPNSSSDAISEDKRCDSNHVVEELILESLHLQFYEEYPKFYYQPKSNNSNAVFNEPQDLIKAHPMFSLWDPRALATVSCADPDSHAPPPAVTEKNLVVKTEGNSGTRKVSFWSRLAVWLDKNTKDSLIATTNREAEGLPPVPKENKRFLYDSFMQRAFLSTKEHDRNLLEEVYMAIQGYKFGMKNILRPCASVTMIEKFKQNWAHMRNTINKEMGAIITFHGTSTSNAMKIAKEGFKVGGEGVEVANGSYYGCGVYSSTSITTALTYCRGICRGYDGGAIVICAVLSGSTTDTTIRCDIYVSKNKDYVLPLYIVHKSDCYNLKTRIKRLFRL